MVNEILLHRLRRLPLLGIAGANPESRKILTEKVVACLDESNIKTLVVQPSARAGDEKPLVSDYVSQADLANRREGEDILSSELLTRLELFSGYYDLLILLTQPIPGVATIYFDDQTTKQSDLLYRYGSDSDISPLLDAIKQHLEKIEDAQAVCGCILIGGKSSRMGQPKHLLKNSDGLSWVEIQVAKLSKLASEVVLSGRGQVPGSLSHLKRIADPPNIEGPLAGILAAMRWHPEASWLICACDMPQIEQSSMAWLLGHRKPGIWGVVPMNPNTGKLEPLFAYYDQRCRYLFESLLTDGELRPSKIGENAKICTPKLPSSLASGWKNYNTPEEVKRLYGRKR